MTRSEHYGVGEALRRARMDAGIRLHALASKMGMSSPNLSRVERGILPFDPAWLERLPADLRGVTARAMASGLREEADRIEREYGR